MNEIIINDRTTPHYKEFWKIVKNFNQLERELCLRAIPTELIEKELERRHKACVDMVQNIYSVLDNAEREDRLTTLDDLEIVCKALRNITKGQPITTTQQATNNPNERIDLILSQGEMESQDG